MPPDLSGARATAEATLVDHCTALGHDPDAGAWTAEDGFPDPSTVELYDGPCSLLQPRDRTATDAGADPRTLGTRVLLLPTDAPQLPAGTQVEVSSTAGTYTVLRTESRTYEVLRRIRLVDATDAEGVPR